MQRSTIGAALAAVLASGWLAAAPSQEGSQEGAQREEWSWLLDLLPPDVTVDGVVLDERGLRVTFGLLDTNGDGRVTFLEFRDRSKQSITRFRSLDLDRDGALRRSECDTPLVLAAERSGLFVDDRTIERLFLQEVAAPLSPPRREMGTVMTDPRIQRALVSLGVAERPAGQPAGLPTWLDDESADLDLSGSAIEVADRLARRLYPLPPPRRPSGKGWGPEGVDIVDANQR